MRGRILAACAALALAVPAHAGIENAGTTAANFLSVGTGPGTLAMGGAAIGRYGHLDLVSWNVGSLGFMRDGGVTLSHANLDEQSTQEWAAVGGRLGMLPTRWALTGLYQNEGTMDGRDASNNPTTSFTVGSAAVGLQVAHPINRNVSVGLGSKWVLDHLGDVNGTGFTFDAGLSARLGPWGAGLSAQNAFGKMTYDGLRYPFPTSYGGGISYTHALSGVTAALDLNVPDADYTNVRGGVEWMWKQAVALRAGYRADLGSGSDDGLAGPTFGMGAGIHGMWLDYGYLIQGQSGGQHRLALSFRPGSLTDDPNAGYGDSDEVPVAAVHPPREKEKPARKPARDDADVPVAKPTPVPASTPVAAAAKPAPQVAVPAPKPVAAPPVATNAPKTAETPVAKPEAVKAPATTARQDVAMGTGGRAIAGARGAVASSQGGTYTPPAAPIASAAPIGSATPLPAKKDTARVANTSAMAVKPDSSAARKPELTQSEMEYQPPTPKAEDGKGKDKRKGKDEVKSSDESTDKPEKRPEKVTVKKGETMRSIGERWGTSAAAIMMENNLVREDVKPGQVLKLPAGRKR